MNIMRTKGFKTLKKYWKPILLIVLLLLLFFPINCNGVFYYKGIRGCNDLLIEGAEEEDSSQTCDSFICQDGSKGFTPNFPNPRNTAEHDRKAIACLKSQKDNITIDDLSWLPIITYNTAAGGGDTAGDDSAGDDSAGGDSAGGDSAGGDSAGGFTVTGPSLIPEDLSPEHPVMEYVCKNFKPNECSRDATNSTLLYAISDMCNDFYGDENCTNNIYEIGDSIEISDDQTSSWEFFPSNKTPDNKRIKKTAGEYLRYNNYKRNCVGVIHECNDGIWKFYDSSKNEKNNWFNPYTDSLITIGYGDSNGIVKAICSDVSGSRFDSEWRNLV